MRWGSAAGATLGGRRRVAKLPALSNAQRTLHNTQHRVTPVIICAIGGAAGVVGVHAAPVAQDDAGADGGGHPAGALIMDRQPDVVPPAPPIPAGMRVGRAVGSKSGHRRDVKCSRHARRHTAMQLPAPRPCSVAQRSKRSAPVGLVGLDPMD